MDYQKRFPAHFMYANFLIDCSIQRQRPFRKGWHSSTAYSRVNSKRTRHILEGSIRRIA